MCEYLFDGFERVVQVFRGAASTEEVVAVRVFDEEVCVSDVVTQFRDFVESRACAAFRGEATDLPAVLDAADDRFEGRELRVVDPV